MAFLLLHNYTDFILIDEAELNKKVKRFLILED